MQQPNTPNIPGMGSMSDTFDLLKNLWGGMGAPGKQSPGMGIPGMVMPTFSIEEIDKQIKDLKAVESWLTVNMNMLHTTIQALEVQSATLSTLQSMSETLRASIKPDEAPVETAKPAYEFPFGFGAAPAAPKSATTASKAAPVPEQVPPPAEPVASAAESAPMPQSVNPVAWWNILQDQFKQAVNTAMAVDAPKQKMKTTSKAAPKSATKSTTKSASESASKSPSKSPSKPSRKRAPKATTEGEMAPARVAPKA